MEKEEENWLTKLNIPIFSDDPKDITATMKVRMRKKEFDPEYTDETKRVYYMKKKTEDGLTMFLAKFIREIPTEIPVFPQPNERVTLFLLDNPLDGEAEEWVVDSTDIHFDPRSPFHHIYMLKISD